MEMQCSYCGAEFDPDDVYDGCETSFMVDGEMIWVNLADFFDYSQRTLCERCAFQQYWEDKGAGEAYEYSLETGHDPVDYLNT